MSNENFKDAKNLQSKYLRLTKAVTAPSRKKLKKRGKRGGLSPQRELARFERQLLESLTPGVLREIIMLEMYAELGTQQVVIFPRILELAAATAETAKRFAYLLIQGTYFWNRKENSPREETPHQFLMLAFTCPCLMEQGLMDSSGIYSLAAGLVDRLVEAARKKDERAKWCLELLYRAGAQFGIYLDPVPRSDWTVEMADQLEAALSISPAQVFPHVIRFPYWCSPKQLKVLRPIFQEAKDELDEVGRKVAKITKEIQNIPLPAFERFLSGIWQSIERSIGEDHTAVLSGGRDKVALKCFLLNTAGLVSLAFVGEDPEEEHGWCPYPKIHVDLFWEQFGERNISRLTITADGEVRGFNRTSWPIVMQKAFYCLLFDAYADIVLPRHDDDETSGYVRNRNRPRSRRHRPCERVVVRPHFRKLVEGWQASPEKVARSRVIMGCAPPEGKTFVDEFTRNLPTTTSLSGAMQDAWESHAQLSSVLVYTDKVLGELLEDIEHFNY